MLSLLASKRYLACGMRTSVFCDLSRTDLKAIIPRLGLKSFVVAEASTLRRLLSIPPTQLGTLQEVNIQLHFQK